MKTIIALLIFFLVIIGLLKLLDKIRPPKKDVDGKPQTRTGFKIIGAFILIFFVVVLVFAFLGPKKTAEKSQEMALTDTGWKPDTFAEGGTFKIEETWEVDDMWKVTINSVRESSERSKFADKNPAAVYVINYTIENTGYKKDGNGSLYLPLDTYIKDSAGQNGYAYPVPTSDDLMPRPTYEGKKNQMEVGIGVDTAGDFKIGVKEIDSNGKLQSAVFIIEP